ncbi:MAG TPA: hypothetical protein VFW85_04545 [Gaiellaceae bacterium]|nr:hypothetical protein [Gaiellaceae bacterium]
MDATDPNAARPLNLRAVALALALAVVTCVAVTATAPAANPRLTPQDRTAIGNLIDRFVKDVVLRRDLADGWTLAGHDLRGGTTRAAWVNGTGVTVEAFPIAGNDFHDAWEGHLVSPGHAVGTIVMHPKPGSAYDETAATVDVQRLHGRWVVDLFYSTAVIRTGTNKRGSCGTADCSISGPADYGPGGGGSPAGNSNARIRGFWLFAAIAAAGALAITIPAGAWVRARRRTKRAYLAYEESHR